MGINYNAEKDTITFTFNEKEIWEQSPEDFLDALDDCLLIRIKRVKLLKITKMEEFIKKMESLAKQASQAEDSLTLQKINVEKLALKEVRHAVKLLQMEEDNIKTEMVERLSPELKERFGK